MMRQAASQAAPGSRPPYSGWTAMLDPAAPCCFTDVGGRATGPLLRRGSEPRKHRSEIRLIDGDEETASSSDVAQIVKASAIVFTAALLGRPVTPPAG